MKLLELLILFVGILVAAALPQLLMAQNIDADEFQKIGGSGGLAVVMLAAYRAWRKGNG